MFISDFYFIYSDTSLDTSETIDEDEEMYPDHKIYRKSAIRFSLVQRFRAIISEEETKRQNNKLPTYKQGSELMGAKIAQPDYADPQKLFGSFTNSQTSLYSGSVNEDNSTENEKQNKSPEKNKKVFDALSLQTVKSYCIDTGQKYLKIKSPMAEKKIFCDKKSNLISSQQNKTLVQNNKNSPEKVVENVHTNDKKIVNLPVNKNETCTDGYYEKILDNTLNSDEKSKLETRTLNNAFEKIQNNKNMSANQKFSCAITNTNTKEQFVNSNTDVKKLLCTESKQPTTLKPLITNPKPVKRPLKPPPPIPAKPTRISQIETHEVVPSTKGWVKTVVGRFE